MTAQVEDVLIAIPMGVPTSLRARMRHAMNSIQTYVRLEYDTFLKVFPRCITSWYIYCDFNENLWPNAQDRLDVNYCQIKKMCCFLRFHLIAL